MSANMAGFSPLSLTIIPGANLDTIFSMEAEMNFGGLIFKG
jgi:hypothetical protein